jgi:hypothetical protein
LYYYFFKHFPNFNAALLLMKGHSKTSNTVAHQDGGCV